MKVDFSQPILDMEGQPIKEGDKPVTLGALLANSLLMMTQADQNISGKEKARRFDLALKVYPGGILDFELDDLAFMKDRIGQTHVPLIVGRVWALLEAPKTIN